MDLCRRPTYWFDASIQGDVKYIQKNLDKQKETYEPRQTKGQIIQGITALHYAIIYNQMEVFDLLFPHEYHLLTDQNVQVAPGSSIIMLCIAGDRIQFLQKILYQIEQCTINDASETALSMCPLYHNSCANLYVNTQICIRYELRIRQLGNVNFIMQCAASLNQDILNWIAMLLQSNCQGIVQEIKLQFKERDERGQTFEQWIQNDQYRKQMMQLAEIALRN